MKDYSLITKKEVRKNKILRNIQRVSCKKYKATKGHFPKARIGKVVNLREYNSYYDFTNQDYIKQDISNLNKDAIINIIKGQGVYGLSGSGFPTHQKLQAVINSKAEYKYLVVNGVECDPGLLQDEWLINNHFSEIEQGISLLANCITFRKILLATREELTLTNTCYQVHTVPNRYPMGAERILIQSVLGITLAPNELPSDNGILVLNVQTVHAIYEAVYMKRPADTRFITIANLTSGEAVVARVNLDTPIFDVAAKVFEVGPNPTIHFGGGIMMARSATPKDRITVKTNFIGYGRYIAFNQNSKCKGCGACSRKCPMEIKVHAIIQGLERNDLTNMKEYHPEKCIQCGTCTYFCRAGKNVMEKVTLLKEGLL